MNPLTISLVQFSAGADAGANRARLETLLAAMPPCDVLALPEVFGLRGDTADYRAAAEPVPGPSTDRLGRMAAAHNAWVLGGSVMERSGDTFYNTCVLVDRAGTLRARYRKMHLFEAVLDSGERVREADAYAAGAEPVLAEIDGWRCGLSICYDLRFPELYRHYAARDAHVFFVPANFTLRTGRDHWETLLKARAIENQCYVIAPNQGGVNARTGVASYGHSLAVDPWGAVLGAAGETDRVFSVRLDPERLASVRGRIPVLAHRRLGLSAPERRP
jgi:deaminated glutathione amidase